MKYPIVFLIVLAACSQPKDLQLPIQLGESKSHVYSILGAPSEDIEKIPELSIPHTQWFKNSGFTIKYDPNEKISSIIIHGPWNNLFLTYKEPIIFGLRVTDTIDSFKGKLGEPIQKKIDSDAPDEEVFSWRKEPYFIEVIYWSKDHVEHGSLNKAGTIFSVEISKAYGGN